MPDSAETSTTIAAQVSATGMPAGISHAAPSEDITMNKYYLEMWIGDLQSPGPRVGFSWWLVPFGIFLTAFFTLATTDFHPLFGFPAVLLQVLAFVILAGTFVASVFLLLDWLLHTIDELIWHKPLTRRQTV